jgi:predicted O-linked N-acetylglucosamine transferase (SPINDLY family)
VVAGLCASAEMAIAKGRWADAEGFYVRAVAMGLTDANAYNNLATLYDRQGIKEKETLDLLCRAHALAPEAPHIKKNLLTRLTRTIEALMVERRFREALPLCQQRVAIEPQSGLMQRELGYCHARLGDLPKAILYYTRAINLEPNQASHYNDLGLACYDLRLLAEAKGAFQQVLNLEPNSIVAYVHLGLLANLVGLPTIAINMLRRAIAIDPTCGEAHNNLALFLRDQGLQDECRKHYVEAMRFCPGSLPILSGYLLSLNDDPHADPGWVAAEHRRFQSAVKGGVRPIVARDLEPARRLRIAYLSPDLRQHSVAYFMLPLIEAHDRSKVEVTCYSTSNAEDGMTERIRSACDRWRSVYRVPDEDLAEMIGRDEIDILVELSGHTAENRLPMLARRVAPIQMTYLGYPNTTGLAEMDYRITDAIADPPGLSDAWYTERLIRVDGGFLAFCPLEPGESDDAETPGDVAEEERRAVTFGSFNNLAKINAKVLDVWASILEGVPGSTLLMKAKGLRDEGTQERIRAVFRARGIDADARVTMLNHERSKGQHLRLYKRVDLALDTFPYNGTTTTCEALWMGAPVVALTGGSHAGRVGASLLSRVGLDELVCPTLQAYVETAVALGNDRDRLKSLRSGLRERLLASPIMNAKRLATELEAAYAQAWRSYCEKPARVADAPEREAEKTT